MVSKRVEVSEIVNTAESCKPWKSEVIRMSFQKNLTEKHEIYGIFLSQDGFVMELHKMNAFW